MSAASLLAVEAVRSKTLPRSVTPRRTCLCGECFVCARERRAERELLRAAGAREAAEDETFRRSYKTKAKRRKSSK